MNQFHEVLVIATALLAITAMQYMFERRRRFNEKPKDPLYCNYCAVSGTEVCWTQLKSSVQGVDLRGVCGSCGEMNRWHLISPGVYVPYAGIDK